ncbi:hypothetical protein H696_03151 [Fonticula alba]|uniref:FHA domain-containing protein n=1 Tax=Fonticula alba TaxID=691883 RepID=A0A058Z951_FONAL|nr:hypothetical protein H696_03151 [Fonticula alba]KCV70800.1 hypothetical protein H696_03151 [Fonticula alba]|eukprot:XP_009495316.1 hypothetical protein H696_03151 [Fonticula alba]
MPPHKPPHDSLADDLALLGRLDAELVRTVLGELTRRQACSRVTVSVPDFFQAVAETLATRLAADLSGRSLCPLDLARRWWTICVQPAGGPDAGGLEHALLDSLSTPTGLLAGDVELVGRFLDSLGPATTPADINNTEDDRLQAFFALPDGHPNRLDLVRRMAIELLHLRSGDPLQAEALPAPPEDERLAWRERQMALFLEADSVRDAGNLLHSLSTPHQFALLDIVDTRIISSSPALAFLSGPTRTFSLFSAQSIVGHSSPVDVDLALSGSCVGIQQRHALIWFEPSSEFRVCLLPPTREEEVADGRPNEMLMVNGQPVLPGEWTTLPNGSFVEFSQQEFIFWWNPAFFLKVRRFASITPAAASTPVAPSAVLPRETATDPPDADTDGATAPSKREPDTPG